MISTSDTPAATPAATPVVIPAATIMSPTTKSDPTKGPVDNVLEFFMGNPAFNTNDTKKLQEPEALEMSSPK